MGIRLIAYLLLFSSTAFAQKEAPVYSLCGKTGTCSMTWEEFSKCKKMLVSDKGLSVGSFIVTITKKEKKDSVFVEYPCKGNMFSKSALENITKLHDDKKLGTKMTIEQVQILESGKEARKVPGMVISLN